MTKHAGVTPPAPRPLAGLSSVPLPGVSLIHISTEFIMASKTISKVVHDTGPVRSDLQSSDSWTAPARPTGKGRTTAQEDRIVEAYHRGGDLDRLVVNYHIRPELLMRILELDPVDHPETYAQLLKTYNDLRARSLR
jgi:hypothetical protein